MVWPGEERAWGILKACDPKDIEANACANYDPEKGAYILKCFNQYISISPTGHEIYGKSELGDFLVRDLGDLSRLSILGYLIHAKDLPLTGELVRPSDLPGGGIFTKGTHVLPLEKIARRFGTEPGKLLSRGEKLGGVKTEYGEYSLKLHPFPRVPLVLVLWPGDDEFPSNASIFFDSSCGSLMPTDIIWATAMTSLGMMLDLSLI